MDLNGYFHNKVLVEREELAFFVDIQYENLLGFCSLCQSIGHSLVNCRKNKDGVFANKEATPTHENQRNGKKIVSKYIPKQKEVINVEDEVQKEKKK